MDSGKSSAVSYTHLDVYKRQVFSCKLQGKPANKAKKLIRELIQEETDGKSHKSNADTKQRTEN